MVYVTCFSCQHKNEVFDKVGFRADCEKCGCDLHCCKNCNFYDSSVYNSCKETSADFVQEKERGNFCDFYEPNQKGLGGKAAPTKDDLKAKAEALFKKK